MINIWLSWLVIYLSIHSLCSSCHSTLTFDNISWETSYIEVDTFKQLQVRIMESMIMIFVNNETPVVMSELQMGAINEQAVGKETIYILYKREEFQVFEVRLFKAVMK